MHCSLQFSKTRYTPEIKLHTRKSFFVLVIAWFGVQLTINLTSGNQGAS